MGSGILASKAVLSSGAGLVTSYVPKCGILILQTALPEAMVITDTEEKLISNINFDFQPKVIGIGIGLGTDNKVALAFESFLKSNKTQLVIDADAINLLSKKKTLLKLLQPNTILTPHPKELERLIGKWKDDFDKIKKTKAFSKKFNIILIIKGAHTIIIQNDKLYVNSNGNPGLATAGTGDVLTGIITGLISQDYEPLLAAIFGVYLHGRAADIAVEDLGYQSLLAGHVIEYLGEAYVDLFKQPEQVNKTNEQQQGENN